MTSRSLFFKEIGSELRRNIWAPVLSLIGFLFCIPLPCAVVIQNYYEAITVFGAENAIPAAERADWMADRLESAANGVSTWLGMENVLVSIGIFLMATLCGVAIFRYLHDRRQVDLFHALPVSRTHLFAVRYLTGVAAVLPIYALIHLITAGVVFALGFGGAISLGMVLGTIGLNCLFFLLLYAIAIFCTVLTGNTIITVGLGVWVSFFLPAFALLVNALMQQNLATFYEAPRWMEQLCYYGSPLVAYFMTAGGNLFFGTSSAAAGWGMVLAYALLTVALTLVCLVLFRIRRSERAGAAMAFQGSKLPVKAVICVIASLAGYLFFGEVLGAFWGGFGFVAALLLSHMVVEVVYHFDFRKAFAHLPHALLFGLLSVALIAGIRMDVFGYDTYRPAAEEVAGMRLHIWGSYGGGNAYIDEDENAWVTDPGLIDEILSMADRGIAHNEFGSDVESTSYDYMRVNLAVRWKLENGRTVTREYNYPTDDRAQREQLLGIITHPDFLRVYSELQALDPAAWADAAEGDNALHIRTAAVPQNGVSTVSVYEMDAITAILEAMQADELARDPDVLAHEAPVLRVDVNYREASPNGSTYRLQQEYLPVYAGDTATLDLIRDFTGVTPVALSAANVDRIQVERSVATPDALHPDALQKYADMYGVATVEEIPAGELAAIATESGDFIHSSETVYVEDPAVIDAILQGCYTGAMDRAGADWLDYVTQTQENADGSSVTYTVRVNLQNRWEPVYYLAEFPFDTLASLFAE